MGIDMKATKYALAFKDSAGDTMLLTKNFDRVTLLAMPFYTTPENARKTKVMLTNWLPEVLESKQAFIDKGLAKKWEGDIECYVLKWEKELADLLLIKENGIEIVEITLSM